LLRAVLAGLAVAPGLEERAAAGAAVAGAGVVVAGAGTAAADAGAAADSGAAVAGAAASKVQARESRPSSAVSIRRRRADSARCSSPPSVIGEALS
jgi:hypothetical protein